MPYQLVLTDEYKRKIWDAIKLHGLDAYLTQMDIERMHFVPSMVQNCDSHVVAGQYGSKTILVWVNFLHNKNSIKVTHVQQLSWKCSERKDPHLHW